MADRLTGFDTPTLTESLEQARSNYASRLGTNPNLRRGVIPVLPFVDGQLVTGGIRLSRLHCRADHLALYATGENLDAQGRMFRVARKAPSRASGTVAMTGTDGATIGEGTALIADDGTAYTVTAESTVADGEAVVSLRADDGGDAGNRVAGETLTLVESLSGVDPTATVVAMAGGADEEEDGAPGVLEHYRARVVAAIPPAAARRQQNGL